MEKKKDWEQRLSIDKELRILWKLCLGLEENVKSVKKYVKRVETARYQQKNTQPQTQLEEYEKRIRIKGEIRGLNELAIKKLKEVGSAKLVKDTPEEITAEQLCEDNRKRMERLINKEMEERGFIRKIKDTPEQKEELVEIKKKLNGISVEYNIIDRIDVIWEEIENLLSEREVFTKDELFMLKLATNDIHNKGNGAYDEIGKKIERMLSKLSKKK